MIKIQLCGGCVHENFMGSNNSNTKKDIEKMLTLQKLVS